MPLHQIQQIFVRIVTMDGPPKTTALMIHTSITERRIRAGRVNVPDVNAAAFPPIHIAAELFATTPPHINETNRTLAKGVHLEI